MIKKFLTRVRFTPLITVAFIGLSPSVALACYAGNGCPTSGGGNHPVPTTTSQFAGSLDLQARYDSYTYAGATGTGDHVDTWTQSLEHHVVTSYGNITNDSCTGTNGCNQGNSGIHYTGYQETISVVDSQSSGHGTRHSSASTNAGGELRALISARQDTAR